MPYTPPPLSTLRSRVARDLRDPNNRTFTTAELDDYINGGLVELDMVHPMEHLLVGIVDWADLSPLPMDYVWRVFVVHYGDTGNILREVMVPPNNDEVNEINGWSLFGGTLKLPGPLYSELNKCIATGTCELRVHGYRDRNWPGGDNSIVELKDQSEEWFLRQYAMWRGWDALRNDRALFQQWQTQSNNSDVSPTQLTNMAATTESEFGRLRKRMYKIRRPAVGW